MSAKQECLKQAYVRIYYDPPKNAVTPRDCTQVYFTEEPRLYAPDGFLNFGIDLLCAVPTTHGAGGVILLLQTTQYVKWQMSFISASGKMVQEWHRIFVSLPMMLKLQGPRVALMALSPLPIKLVGYAGVVGTAFRAIEEVEKVFKFLLSVQKTWCPHDVVRLNEGLKALEAEFNIRLQQAKHAAGDLPEIASTMQYKPPGAGEFAGARFG
jgi:hypothetical protein